MPTPGDAPATQYALGHSAGEVERLIDQARFFGDLTERLFRDAGMAPSMRVLDVGCGVGDVSFLAARLIGPDGAVTGVDRSPDAITAARARAADAGLTNVQFIDGDLERVTVPQPVDMVVGRLVLMYFADPTAVVRHLRTLVKHAGVLAFQEFDVQGATSEPSCPLFESTVDRLRQTFRRGGIGVRTGLDLGRIFERAGLESPTMLLAARVERGPSSRLYRQVADVTRAVLPLMTRTGVASAEGVDVDTLEARLRDEAVALDATLVAPPLIGAWARNG